MRRRSPRQARCRVFPLIPPALRAVCLLALAACAPVSGPALPEAPTGSGSFEFSQSVATADRPVTVWYHRPAGLERDAPVLFVMHGTLRNGEDYRDQWVEQAERHRFLVVVPEFSREDWPGSRGSNLGHAFHRAAERRARELGARLGWRIETVPGVGHSNTRMAPAAAALLYRP